MITAGPQLVAACANPELHNSAADAIRQSGFAFFIVSPFSFLTLESIRTSDQLKVAPRIRRFTSAGLAPWQIGMETVTFLPDEYAAIASANALS